MDGQYSEDGHFSEYAYFIKDNHGWSWTLMDVGWTFDGRLADIRGRWKKLVTQRSRSRFQIIRKTVV